MYLRGETPKKYGEEMPPHIFCVVANYWLYTGVASSHFDV